MLLFKCIDHYKAWTCFQENIPDDQKEKFKENPIINLPESWWSRIANLPRKTYFMQKEFLVDPLIVDTFGFTQQDLDTIQKEYLLYESEQESGRCPFCRVHGGSQLMPILFPVTKKPSWTYCTHLLFDDRYEILTPKEAMKKGWQFSSGLRKVMFKGI
jgi:hypothetical protein